MESISRKCEQCRQYITIRLVEDRVLKCPECSKEWGKLAPGADVFDRCPVCQCRQFYIQKDFNQVLGCLVMLVGIIFVPFTYGLSLPVCAMIDWIIYKRIPTIALCYRCDAEFRGVTVPAHLKTFMHHIGVKYDKNNEYR